MKRHTLALAAALFVLPLSALAHKQWLVPSSTVVAGKDVWVTVDAAVSNQLYYPDHVAMRLDNIVITAPDGSTHAPQNPATGKYRSVFDVQLQQQGTYRIANTGGGVSASWEAADKLCPGPDGKPAPAGPRGCFLRNASADDIANKIPKNAQNVKVSEGISRVETFVTNGSTSNVATIGKGLELAPVTHPNDLFAGEEATFKLLVDGKPAAGLEIEIVRGGTRYRNAQDEITVTTDANGEFKVNWPEAGMYWLETSTTDDKTSVPQAKQRRLSYVATLEVLPQ
ncbi:MAG: DUF4198 domain-containing protein [Thermomonas sp.]|uniref:DUF4198 domain-containing protein n=1 Tax=Thermomonas sp. TaxID=1971895 RepID=UPI0039E37BA8